MSARSRAFRYPVIGTFTQSPAGDTTSTVTPATYTATPALNTLNAIEVDEFTEGLLCVEVSAISGTGATLALATQTSPDGGVTWIPFGPVIANLTAVGSVALPFGATTAGGPFGYMLRLVPTISGTSPSITVAAWFIGK